MKNLARGAFQVSQDYFPETMSQLAIVNAPSSFTAIWSVMRPWLAKETVAKVSVLGANYQRALLELVDAENLPETLGGTCTCADCASADTGGDLGSGGVAEMGRCAFSSAGPWLVGRKERRAAWLRGERDIALQPGEIEKFAAKAEQGEAPQPEAPHAPKEDVEHPPAQEKDDDASTDSTSPGPSTPGVDSVQHQLDQVEISAGFESEHSRRQLTPEESLQLVTEKHPETRQVQTGDLHLD